MARDSSPRGLRDEADVGPAPREPRALQRLSELRYKVADGEPDVRGWRVYASTGRELGTVSDLLVDADAGEVVMLDIDLRRNDQHTLAPIRAAWIDHATRRVVLDAREVDQAVTGTVAGADAGLPALPRAGALSDADVRRFNDDYVRAYGDRGFDADRGYRLRRGDEELRFADAAPRADGPRRLLDADPAPAPPPAAGAAFAESERINAELAGGDAAAARQTAARTTPADPGSATPTDPTLAAAAAAADARFAQPPERRADRVDDAAALDADGGIDPRELDARVRIDEGGTVDADAPLGGVRYDGPAPATHSYGQPDDAYGPGHGDGRINFDKVVSRHPYAGDATPEDAPAERPVRYRSYEDRYGGPLGE